MKSKSFLMILILLILPFMGLAQSPYGNDVVEIVIEKGGQLESNLKKANALNTKKLSIISSGKYSSVLNEKDFTFLSGMNQLEELYIDVDIDGNKFNTYKFQQKHGKLSNVNFPNLKKFGFGENPRGEVQDLFQLKVQGLVIDGDETYFPRGISFEDVYIISKPDVSGSRGFLDEYNNWLVLDADDYRDHYTRLEDPYRQKVHSIHVSSRDWLNSKVCEKLNPAVIYIHTGQGVEKYLANYNSLLYEADKDLTQYDGILSAALTNTTFGSLRIPDKQTTIGDRFFDNVTVNSINLNNVKAIGKNAFYGSHIKEIHIPSTVQDIDKDAFNNSEITTIYMDGEYAPAISSNYPSESFGNIQFIIPKGSKGNYNIGAWKKLRVLEDGASTTYAFEVAEPGTLASLLTDDIKKNVVSLKLRGVLFSDDIKILEDCPNLRSLDLAETFIAQSPKEVKEKQETSDYLAGIFMNMGVIAQSEFEHDRISTTDNMQVQYLAKLGEMAKNQTIESDPNCQMPILGKTKIEELVLPLQLQKVVDGYGMYPRNLKKITLPPDLKEFSIYPHKTLTEIILPSSVQSIKIMNSNPSYENLQSIDMSACENPSIEIEGKFEKSLTIKFPETYTNLKANIGGYQPVNAYFKGRELSGYFFNYKTEESTIYIPRGSRAGYSSLIQKGYKVVEE